MKCNDAHVFIGKNVARKEFNLVTKESMDAVVKKTRCVAVAIVIVTD